MFGFQPNSVRASKDVACVKNNVVIHSIYQVPSYGAQGLHWMVNVGKYWIVSENMLKNFQNIVLMPNKSMFIANVAVLNIEVKREPEYPLTHY
jgi:hypothetical protein